MATSLEEYRQSDVNAWGLIAVFSVGLAVVSMNLTNVLPLNILSGLHSTRVEGGTLNQLRAQISALEAQNARIHAETVRLDSLVALARENQTVLAQRVGSIETTLPVVLERLPLDPGIDISAVTASVPDTEWHLRDVPDLGLEGTAPPLNDGMALPDGTEDDLVSLARIETNEHGVALGATTSLEDVYVRWTELREKASALIAGLEPILLPDENGGYQLVAGPIASEEQARQMCVALVRAGIACRSAPYSGYAMPQ